MTAAKGSAEIANEIKIWFSNSGDLNELEKGIKAMLDAQEEAQRKALEEKDAEIRELQANFTGGYRIGSKYACHVCDLWFDDVIQRMRHFKKHRKDQEELSTLKSSLAQAEKGDLPNFHDIAEHCLGWHKTTEAVVSDTEKKLKEMFEFGLMFPRTKIEKLGLEIITYAATVRNDMIIPETEKTVELSAQCKEWVDGLIERIKAYAAALEDGEVKHEA